MKKLNSLHLKGFLLALILSFSPISAFAEDVDPIITAALAEAAKDPDNAAKIAAEAALANPEQAAAIATAYPAVAVEIAAAVTVIVPGAAAEIQAAVDTANQQQFDGDGQVIEDIEDGIIDVSPS